MLWDALTTRISVWKKKALQNQAFSRRFFLFAKKTILSSYLNLPLASQNVVCRGESANKVLKIVLASHAALIQLLFHSPYSYLWMRQPFLQNWRKTFWSSKGYFSRKKGYTSSLGQELKSLFFYNKKFDREISAGQLLF